MNGFEYGYRVYPYTKKGTRGDTSNTFTIKWEKPPEAPKDVSVSADDGMVELKWPKEEGYLYNVYRYNGATYPLFALNQARLAAGSFMDSGLTNNTKYTYEVRKVKEIGGIFREGEGIKVKATPIDKTPPRQPEMVKAVKKGNLVSITWKENTEKDLAGYNIYRVIGSKKEKINRELIKENSFLDKKIPDERFVSYYVTALDEAGNESEPSRESIVILKKSETMNYFEYQKSELYCEDVPIKEIVKAVGTPLYIYSYRTFERHFQVFDNAFQRIPHLVCYSCKANANGALLRTINKLGGGADIVSGGELYKALRAGIPHNKIVFSGVGKTKRN